MSQPNYQQAPYVLTPVEQKSKSEQRNCLRWMVGCSLLIFVLCCVLPACGLITMAVLASVSESNKVTDRSTETLPITDLENITLDVRNEVGETRVVADTDATEITVDIIRTATGLTDSAARDNLAKLKAEVRQEGNRYIIDATGGDGGFASGLSFGENSVDLRITLPAEIATMLIETNVGALTVEGVTITQKLDLTNEVGSIEFYGTLTEGSHTITSDVGAVQVTLASNSSVEIDAKSDVGDISVDSGMLTNQDKNSSGAGQTLTGTYGEDDPAAGRLTIRSDVGSIEIRER
ncbi:MAG: hypothetical protein BroJett018_49520 [Chloroflexota bacterium]|nr:MAG: hypothetical protein BroJett018_49520 [Chloroflexota bacterium]